MNITPQAFEVQNQTLIPNSLSEEWTHDEVRQELSRILKSRFFIKSIRLSCFLSTAVEYLLDGKADKFKEYTVGTEVYKRPTSYDPTEDTIVRTEARRLRTKLKEYYSESPRQNRVKIALAIGSYVPVIEMRDSDRFEDQIGTAFSPVRLPRGNDLWIGVPSFSASVADSTIQHLACSLEEQLTHELAQTAKVKVFRTSIGIYPTLAEQFFSWGRSGVQFALHGYLRQSPEGALAQIQLATLQGMILWSGRFNGEALQGQFSEVVSTVRNAVLSSSELIDRSVTRELALAN